MLRPLQPRVIYDIGANVGTWTLLAKTFFPQAEIQAFEPLADHVERFRANTRALSNVYLHTVCLGSSRGEASMRVANKSDASSLLPMTDIARHKWSLSEVGEVMVPMLPLDDAREDLGLAAPALIKLDIQGFELEALRGAQTTLESTSAVLCEICFEEYYHGQCSFEDVTAFLSARGFCVFALSRVTDLGRPLSVADVLYVRRDATARLRAAA